MLSLGGKFSVDPYTKTATAWGRAALWVVSIALCRAPYAGVSRVRFQGTLSTLILGVPLAVQAKDTRPGLQRKLYEVAAMAYEAEGEPAPTGWRK